ncbi:MAG TPA: WYL domain-containing protein [Flavitalea sp.]|nr:WYL domain-containing protein [Flavitalea sp.]
MPLNKSAYIRYRIIDQCLTNTMRTYPTKEFILDKVSEVVGPVSQSSLEKDFGKMKELFNAPIQYNRAQNGYHYTEEGFSIKEFPLTEEEIEALDFSTAVLQVLKQTPIFQRFEGAIEKVISGYRAGKLLGKEDDEIIQVEAPLSDSGSQFIQPLYQSILQLQPVFILYKSFVGEAKEHLFCPYLLKEYRNRWYVVGNSSQKENIIVLALDRIREIKVAKAKWVPDDSFRPNDYFKYSFGITQVHGAKPETVELSLTPLQSKYVLSQPLHASQKIISESEQEVKISLEVYLTQELVMTILGLGAGVKVLKPKDLVQTITDEIKKMNELY